MGTVLVTGANRGVGLELARMYAEQGDDVIACCRNPDAAEALQALAGAHKSLTIEALEVTSTDSIDALGARLGKRALDILINNAGTGGPFLNQEPDAGLDVEAWLETFRVNTIAPFHLVRRLRSNLAAATAPKAISVTSQMGAIAFTMPNTMVAYCASKAALNKVMHMAADDLKADGIAVLLVHPGWVRTDMGGSNADISAEESARGIVAVIAEASLATTGSFRKWNGEVHPW